MKALSLLLTGPLLLAPPAAPKPTTRPPATTKESGYKTLILGGSEPRFVGEPISLDLKDADLRDVLKTFAKLEKLNLAIDPEVRGSVTVRLENVPWDQALDVILRTNGLGYVLEGRILRVAAPAKLLDPP